MPFIQGLPWIYQFLIELAINVVVAKVLAPKSGAKKLDAWQGVEYSGTVEPRKIIYGEVLSGGLAPASAALRHVVAFREVV